MRKKAAVDVTMHPLLLNLSHLTDAPQVLEVRASTTSECLRMVVDQYPSMRRWTYDKEGKPLLLIRFLINGKKVRGDQFARRLRDGDQLMIFFAPS